MGFVRGNDYISCDICVISDRYLTCICDVEDVLHLVTD